MRGSGFLQRKLTGLEGGAIEQVYGFEDLDRLAHGHS
jgi:hypothetical protein